MSNSLQFYVVTGGSPRGGGNDVGILASTEILKKGEGHSWKTVASLPARNNFCGVSLPNGHFMVSGEEY